MAVRVLNPSVVSAVFPALLSLLTLALLLLLCVIRKKRRMEGTYRPSAEEKKQSRTGGPEKPGLRLPLPKEERLIWEKGRFRNPSPLVSLLLCTGIVCVLLFAPKMLKSCPLFGQSEMFLWERMVCSPLSSSNKTFHSVTRTWAEAYFVFVWKSVYIFFAVVFLLFISEKYFYSSYMKEIDFWGSSGMYMWCTRCPMIK